MPLAAIGADMRERGWIVALAIRIDSHLPDGGLGLIEVGGKPALAGPDIVGRRPKHEIAFGLHVRVVRSDDEILATLLLVRAQGSCIGERTLPEVENATGNRAFRKLEHKRTRLCE